MLVAGFAGMVTLFTTNRPHTSILVLNPPPLSFIDPFLLPSYLPFNLSSFYLHIPPPTLNGTDSQIVGVVSDSASFLSLR